MAREKTRREGRRGGRGGGGGRRGERGCCRCNGLWIFVALGLVLEVLGVVLGGVYLNVTSITTSLHHVQILPTYVPVVAVLVTGLLVLILFCRRWSVLVFVTSMLSVAVSLLCATTSVLMGTHILRPMMHFTHCTLSRDRCHCYSPFNRQDLAIEYSEDALTSYVYEGVTSCDVIQHELIHALIAMCAIYVMLFVVCALVAVVGLLAYCALRLAKPAVQSDSYEEIFTVSQSSSSPHASDDSEQPAATQPLTTSTSHTHPPSSSSAAAAASQFIYSPSDIPLDYNEACRMRQRSHSFSQPRRQNQSFDSSDSNPVYATSTLGRGEGRRQGEGQGQGRLKEHRRRARRAVTLANLDHQQLMLIMSLQLRYLQENQSDRQFQLNNQKLERQTRRALTPTPCQERTASSSTPYSDTDHRPVKLVRSHTPVPHPTFQPPPPPPPSFSFPGDYENAGVTSLVDYENVDSCRPAQSSGRTSRQAGLPQEGQRDGSKSRQSSLSRMSAGGVKPNTGCALNAETDESAYVIMHGSTTSSVEGHRMGEVTSAVLDNSYENVDGLSVRDHVAAASAAHRDPLYENQKESLAARRLKTKVDTPRNPPETPQPHNFKSSLPIISPNPTHLQHQQPSSPRRLTTTTLTAHPSPSRTTPHSPSTHCSPSRHSITNLTRIPNAVDAEKPTRPKSYISAVEGEGEGEGGLPNNDSERDDTLSVSSDSRHNRPRHYGPHWGRPDGSPAREAPLRSPPLSPCSGRTGFSHGGSPTDIYAMPQKKGRVSAASSSSEVHPAQNVDVVNHLQQKGASPLLAQNRSPCPGGDRSTPLPGQERNHRSAFHQVSRHQTPSAYHGAAPCDTDLDDLDPLPSAALPRKRSLQTPPYSSPPSYQSLASSRHGSQHSLLSQHSQHSVASSSSHNTAEDLDSDLYKQIRKKRSAGTNGGHQRYANGDTPQRYVPGDFEHRPPGTERTQYRLPSGDPSNPASYHSSSLRTPYPRATRGHGEGQGRGQVLPTPGWNDYFYQSSDHAGIHSFPFRKHHPPYPGQPYPHPPPNTVPQPVPGTQPTLARSYENLDDVFPPPPSQCGGQRSGQGQRGRPVKAFQLEGGGLSYEDVFHLATAQEGDSDPETVETVI